MKKNVLTLLAVFTVICAKAQQTENQKKDSLYISETENILNEPVKVLHAEPLYIDLIRDLGARKGEKEWNVGFGITDNQSYDEYLALVEYEWAVIDRLGLEIELPFTFFYNTSDLKAPSSKLNGLKTAIQYSFFVSEKYKTSLALGYINELEFAEFDRYGKEKFVTGNSYNPFFVAAKRWGNNYHTLLYTGPVITQHFHDNFTQTVLQVNTNFHYMISGTRNFIGVEFNKEIYKHDFDMVIRPQMRLEISEQLMIGIVTGIPISRENQRFSTFLRLIYEPH